MNAIFYAKSAGQVQAVAEPPKAVSVTALCGISEISEILSDGQTERYEVPTAIVYLLGQPVLRSQAFLPLGQGLPFLVRVSQQSAS